MNEEQTYAENSNKLDDYFSNIAIVTSRISDDPHRQVGAVIVSKDNVILSYGSNGAPKNINPNEIPWGKTGNILDTKYPYTIHAELNAIISFYGDRSLLRGSRIYTTLFPCNECMKAIIQSGITEVIYLDNHNYQKEAYVASRHLVEMHNATPGLPKIVLRGYKVSEFEKHQTSQAIQEERIVVPPEEVAAYDKTLSIGLSRNLKR